MELVEAEESVEPVEVRIVDVVVLPTACRTKVHQWECTGGLKLLSLPELESENRKSTARSTQERYRIDVFRGLWAKLFSTTRVQPCGGALDSSNSRLFE